ncbi:V-set and immunoglobulin domain-containing protein 1-like [Dendropsophus ebraccatus]|uniref:V-set and immunoglobulin domain-containing protein 1-like n=1 Tax=Dendropsophus ebraccatus TaxID=150705 RepID=UPI0038319E36
MYYSCEAVLQLGSERHTVESSEIPGKTFNAPTCPSLTVSPNAIILKGNSLIITCRSDGSPAPTYSWQIPNKAGVTYSPDKSSVIIHEATWTHSGTYTCVARNVHGGSDAKQEVTVVSDGYVGLVIGIVIGVMCLIFLGALVGYFWWKKGRKGKATITIQSDLQTMSEIPSGTSEPK